jgi:hypothetical protein
MTNSDIISSSVEAQFPDFVRTEGPKLVAFIKAYYEWMETEGQASETFKNLLNYQDIDTTLDSYIDFFKREVLSSIPKEVIADERLLVKHIKDLYRARGSELSYRLLFRMLYNEEIEFFYPGDVILRASDGHWVTERSIRISAPKTGDITQLPSSEITGSTSGATARVDKVSPAKERGVSINELYVTHVIGTFLDGEIIRNSSNTITATVFNAVGPLNAVTVIGGGASHQSGDNVNYYGQDGSGTRADGYVISTTDFSAIKFRVVDGGYGYRANSNVTVVKTGSGIDGDFKIGELTDLEYINLNTDRIYEMRNCVVGTEPYFISLGANTAKVSEPIAYANLSTVLNVGLEFANTAIGTIDSVITTNPGYAYDTMPNVTVLDNEIAQLELIGPNGDIKGTDAFITADHAPGAIETLHLGTRGAGYSRHEIIDVINTTRDAYTANGSASITGVIVYPAGYSGTRGFLSGDHKLQDNKFYQEYSYVIETLQSFDTYASIIKASLHPAGTAVFGTMSAAAHLDQTAVAISPSEETVEIN